tara:strand:+ start:6178 stop:6687 length:510 start_codon:yes stop_codon:yes gene_type:complete
MNIIHQEKVTFKDVYHQDNKNLIHLNGDFNFIVEKNDSEMFSFSLKDQNDETVLHSDLNIILGKYLEYCFFEHQDEKYIFILVKEGFEEFVEEVFDNSSECLTANCILGFDGTLVQNGLNYDPQNHEYQEYLFQLPSEFDKDSVEKSLSGIGMTHNQDIHEEIKHIFSF